MLSSGCGFGLFLVVEEEVNNLKVSRGSSSRLSGKDISHTVTRDVTAKTDTVKV